MVETFYPSHNHSGHTDASELGMDLDDSSLYPTRRRVMVVEDDPDTAFLLKLILRQGGYDVQSALGGMEALKKCNELLPDLVLLDLMMPEMDGWETLRNMRKIANIPVIIVTARANRDDVVHGLRLGADDYVTKPFYDLELVARVQSVLRRTGKPRQDQWLTIPEIGMVLDFRNWEVTLRNRPVQLTRQEFNILALLAKSSNEIVRHETIAMEIWGEDSLDIHNRIKYLVYLLRRKLERNPSQPEIIVTREGLGYMLQTKKSESSPAAVVQ